MELVKLTCTNCGAPLEEKDGMLRCAHCGCGYIRVCDPSEGFDAAAMSIEEFEQKLADASELFAVKGADGTELFDTDAEVAASKLRYASERLASGDFEGAYEAVSGFGADGFQAERVRLLASMHARDEGELAAYCGDITAVPHFKEVLALADDRARATYLRLADICAAGAEASRKIKKGMGFVDAHDAEKAGLYAAEMLRAYPLRSEAWELSAAAKCLADEKYDPSSDLEFMKKCPDYKYVFAPDTLHARALAPVVAERYAAFSAKKDVRARFFNKYVIGPLGAIVLVGIGIALWKLIEALG